MAETPRTITIALKVDTRQFRREIRSARRSLRRFRWHMWWRNVFYRGESA